MDAAWAKDTARWDDVYAERGVDGVSWAQSRPAESLDAISRVAPARDAAILDLGGGASALAAALVELGYRDVTVLDLSSTAMSLAADRLGDRATRVNWLQGDVRSWEPQRRYAVWHDRAVFHFMTSEPDRAGYRRALRAGLAAGGHVIAYAFAPDGPGRCSGQRVCRYDAEGLHDALDPGLILEAHGQICHVTPRGVQQPFVWVRLRDGR